MVVYEKKRRSQSRQRNGTTRAIRLRIRSIKLRVRERATSSFLQEGQRGTGPNVVSHYTVVDMQCLHVTWPQRRVGGRAWCRSRTSVIARETPDRARSPTCH